MINFIDATVYDCNVIELNVISGKKGAITPVSAFYGLPFAIKRVYYLYDIPGGSERGGHAHYKLQQYLVAASGAFDVVLKDGGNDKLIHMNRPYQALHIIPGIWRELVNFSYGSVCLVLASLRYDETDYIRDYENFKKAKIL